MSERKFTRRFTVILHRHQKTLAFTPAYYQNTPADGDSVMNEIEKLYEEQKSRAVDLQRLRAMSVVRIEAFRKSLSVLNGSSTPAVEMVINEKIRKEQAELEEVEAKIRESNAMASAYREALKAIAGKATSAVRDIRPTSELARIRDILRAEGKKLPLSEILERRGKADDKTLFHSLRGTLGQYAKNKRVFTKDAVTGEIGLIEFDFQEREATS